MNSKITLIILVLIILLSIRTILFFKFQPQIRIGDKTEINFTILQDPSISGSRQIFNSSISNGISNLPIKIVLPLFPKYKYGSTLFLSGIIEKDKFGNYELNYPKVSVKKSDQNPIFTFLGNIRQTIKNNFEENIPQPLSGLMLGIVFGIKENMPKDFLAALSQSGVTHVISASGMNVTMTGEFILGILLFFLSRRRAIFFTILGIWFYVFLAGLAPSIIRAGIMLSFAFTGQLLGRQYSNVWGLFLAAILMVANNPLIVGDVGFQLSFMSTVGILTMQPLLTTLPIVKEDLATTISAQLATLPILLGAFGQYGLLSILVNGLILWTVPILMVLGSVGAVLSLILPVFCKYVLFLAVPLLWFFQQTVVYFGSLGLTLKLSFLPTPIVVGYYLLLGSLVILLSKI